MRSLHGSGDALQDDEGRDMERRLKTGILSTHLQTLVAANKHGADEASTHYNSQDLVDAGNPRLGLSTK